MFKQTKEEYYANVAEAEQKMLPAVLANESTNGTIIAEWLKNNATGADGKIDASAYNFRRAVVVNKTRLAWVVPPAGMTERLQREAAEAAGIPIRNMRIVDRTELDRETAAETERKTAARTALFQAACAEADRHLYELVGPASDVHQAYRLGRLDRALTESRKNQLQSIVRNAKNSIEALDKVNETIASWDGTGSIQALTSTRADRPKVKQ